MLRIYFCSSPIDGNSFDLNQHRNRNKNRITYCKKSKDGDATHFQSGAIRIHAFYLVFISNLNRTKCPVKIYKQSPKFIVIDNISVSIYFSCPYFLTITLKFSRQKYALLGRSFTRLMAHPYSQTQMQSKRNK